jgi:hypothetical protein
MSEHRECRLRPGYAELYDEIPPGLWMPAREVVAVLVRRASQARQRSIHQRTFDPRHFEFRGGPPEPRRQGVRTRSGDRIGPSEC